MFSLKKLFAREKETKEVSEGIADFQKRQEHEVERQQRRQNSVSIEMKPVITYFDAIISGIQRQQEWLIHYETLEKNGWVRSWRRIRPLMAFRSKDGSECIVALDQLAITDPNRRANRGGLPFSTFRVDRILSMDAVDGCEINVPVAEDAIRLYPGNFILARKMVAAGRPYIEVPEKAVYSYIEKANWQLTPVAQAFSFA